MNRKQLRAATVEADPRWRAVVERDPRADGTFFFSVKTTGVYCRPSCRSRRPRPENLAFHGSAEDAERAGFRACRRCQPRGASPSRRRAEAVAAACRRLEDAAETPRLDELARPARVSATRFRRMFEAQVGLTPREFAAGRRAERVRTRLAEGERVTGALYGAGFGSSGRFYEAAAGILGMEPSRYRSGGAGLDIAHAVLPCSLGLVLAAATARGVCAILLGEDRSCLTRDLARRFPRARLVEATPGFARVLEAVVKLVDDPRRGLDLPLDVRGTAFQERVWRALRAVPAGRTVTYTELARAAGAPRAVRAAAAACAANPLAVAIPCHRAVRGDGGLAGYRWGLPRKRRLLAAEAEDRSVKG